MGVQRVSLATGLQRLDRALHGAQVRQVTEREDQLQREWEVAIAPILSDLYWEPLQRIQDAPEDEESLRAWLLTLLLAGFARRRLIDNLDAYLRWSADVGGAMALDLMGVGGGFHLSNGDLLDVLDDRRAQLVEPATDLSLIDTTADQLASAITAARRDDVSPLVAVAGLAAVWVATRAHAITINEMTWAVATTQIETYRRNAIERQMFTTRYDGRVCAQCSPLHGVIVAVANVPRAYAIPQHIGCRCVWRPVTDNWQPPETIWRGA